MSTRTILSIVKELNGGSILPWEVDEVTHFPLLNSNTQLYLDRRAETKFFFFSSYQNENDDSKRDNLRLIEQEALEPEAYIHSNIIPTPTNSYMVLFYQLPDPPDFQKIYREVIKLEENEFLFKKYVFYYTQAELSAFNEWYAIYKTTGIETINQLLQLDGLVNDLDKPAVQFFIRLLIKLPFLTFDFKTASLQNFDEKIHDKLSNIRGEQPLKDKTQEISQIFTRVSYLDMEPESLENVASTLIMEEIGNIDEQLQNMQSEDREF